ncbi:MAG TPA: hypothetical protein VGJ26_06690 [Pirellulales bacterium]
MARPNEDPLVTSARREALFALVVWGAATIYSVGYCALNGYNRSAESLTFVLWFPDWIFWGVIVPWFSCLAVSFCFAMFYMRDDDLGVAAEGDSAGEPPPIGAEESASPPRDDSRSTQEPDHG